MKSSSSTRLSMLILCSGWTFATSASVKRHRQPALRASATEVTREMAASCVALVNHGTHSTVNIEVGTPEQEFSVVADTGSDSVIIPSCICVQNGRCNEDDRCFTGTNVSSTFEVSGGAQGPLATVITFGSGPVEAVIASDLVRVGQVTSRMDNGLLLMVDQNLNIPTFEGILGLGLPKDKRLPLPEHRPEPQDAHDGPPGGMEDIIRQIMGGAAGGGGPMAPTVHQSALATGKGLPVNGSAPPTELAEGNASWPSWPSWPFSRDEEVEEPAPFEDVGFLETAGVARFSMCFNDGADGMLRLNPPAAAKTLGNVGREHWALDFRGISVGNNATSLGFCGTDGMREGQETACGGIPDSGTTVIMAPQDQLDILFDGLCEEWDRCRQNYTAMLEAAEAAHEAAESHYNIDPFDIVPASKSALFQFLLMDCDSWLDSSHNLDELPPIKFNVAGLNGTEQTLEMPGWSYVIESAGENSSGAFNISSPRMCQPAFGAMDFNTELNGPVWIFGTPFFYMFDIGYDLGSNPPGISLTSVEESPCGTCDSEATVSLVSDSHGGLAASNLQRRQRAPRRVEGRRWPSIDFSRGL